MGRVVVLRMGHRFFRDSRVTTHVCLTARALGADGVIIADREDKTVESTIREVARRFGGDFSIESGNPWRKTIRDWSDEGGKVVHLTAYAAIALMESRLRDIHRNCSFCALKKLPLGPTTCARERSLGAPAGPVRAARS